MTDSADTPPAKKAAKKAATEADASPPAQVAKIRTLVKGVAAKGFTFGAGQVVERVPMPHAEYLVTQRQAEILEVS